PLQLQEVLLMGGQDRFGGLDPVLEEPSEGGAGGVVGAAVRQEAMRPVGLEEMEVVQARGSLGEPVEEPLESGEPPVLAAGLVFAGALGGGGPVPGFGLSGIGLELAAERIGVGIGGREALVEDV